MIIDLRLVNGLANGFVINDSLVVVGCCGLDKVARNFKKHNLKDLLFYPT